MKGLKMMIKIAIANVLFMAAISSAQIILTPPGGVCAMKIIQNNGDPAFIPDYNLYGFIGTNTNKFYAGYFNKIYYSTLSQLSDETAKQNITNLENVFEKLKNVKTVRYDYIEPGRDPADSKNKIGFLAQDLMKQFPEMVKKNDESGQYYVNYVGMIPVLLKAVQDLKATVDLQEKTIAELSKAIPVKK